jgi:hypothetical protein
MTERRLPGDDSWFHGDPAEVAVAPADSTPGSPTWPLLLAGGGLLVAAVTLAGGVGLQVIGYLSASLLLFTAVAWFRRISLERAVNHGLGTSSRLNAVALTMLVGGFALALVHAWKIAIHFS